MLVKQNEHSGDGDQSVPPENVDENHFVPPDIENSLA